MQEMQESRVQSLGREDSLEEGMATHGESHGQRSLAGYSPWGHKESDTTQQLSMHSRRCLWYKRTLLPVLTAGPAVLFSGCVCVWFLFGWKLEIVIRYFGPVFVFSHFDWSCVMVLHPPALLCSGFIPPAGGTLSAH